MTIIIVITPPVLDISTAKKSSTRSAADILLENFTVGGLSQSAYGFFLDLTDAFSCELEFFADFFESQRIIHSYAEVGFNNIGFSRGEYGK